MTVEESTAVTDQVTVEASGFFTRRHQLLAADQEIAELVFRWLTLQAQFTDVEGRQLMKRRTSWWRPEYEMREGEQVWATAIARPFQRRVEIEFAGEWYEMRAANLWGTVWELTGEEGDLLLTLEWRGWRSWSKIALHAPEHSDLMAFAHYLLITRLRARRRRRVG